MDEFTAWLLMVDPRTVERERFNVSVTKLRQERPGSKADRERKRVFAEELEWRKARAARWGHAPVDPERLAQAERLRANRAYNLRKSGRAS